MADLLERRKALHQQAADAEEKLRQLEGNLTDLQPLANLGMAWAMTAHELNNLMMPVLNYSQLALQNPDDRKLCEKALQKTLNVSEQIGDMMEKIMALAGSGSAKMENHPLSQIFDDVFTCLGRDFAKDRIRVTRDIDTAIEVRVDATSLRQALMNLLLNARHSMLEKGGRLDITAEQTADAVTLRIADTGCGMAPQRLKDIFTPFFTEGKHNGNGLGLAFCRKVIEAHGGYIQADSAVNQGTTFKIVLPKFPI